MITCLDATAHTKRSVLALGMFDGVHIGHEVLFHRARALADQAGAPLVCDTFTNHPLTLVAPERAPAMLSTLEERAARMASLGVDILCAQSFDERMRQTPPEDFIGRMVRRWRPVQVVVGYNYTFGKGGKGTPGLLSGVGEALGFGVSVVPEIRMANLGVSSSGIRLLLSDGNVSLADRLLGRPYEQDVVALSADGALLWIRPQEDGKQTVGRGLYRVLLSQGSRRLPCLARVDEEGRICCRGALPCEPGEVLRVAWLMDAEGEPYK